MAGASQKKIAISNNKILTEIHLISLVILLSTGVVVGYLRRPINPKPFLFLNIPLILCQYVLETSGRPKYSNGKLVGTVSDLRQEGLTEYMFDIIYFTLFENLLMILSGSNKVWWLYCIIPGFAGYKLFFLVKMGKNLLGIGGNKNNNNNEIVNEEPEQPVKSKRQAKLEARGQKGKRKVIR